MGIMRNRRDRFFILFRLSLDQFSWRGVGWFVVVYFGAFAVAGVVGPLIYAGVQGMGSGAEGSVLEYLQGKPLSDYVDRVRLLAAAASLVWLISYCGLWGRFGYFRDRDGLGQFRNFFVLGLFSMGLLFGAQALLLPVEWEVELNLFGWIWLIVGALLGSLVLAWLEESIFRGMVFRMFYTAVRPHLAIVLASLAFAAVHFKDVPFPPGEGGGWYAGLWIAVQQSISFLFTAEATAFANYFLVGVVLCLVFLRTQSLIPCLALHAGWVAARGVWWEVAEVPGGSAAAAFWGTESVVDGYGALLMLGSLAAAFYVSWQRAQRSERVSLGGLT